MAYKKRIEDRNQEFWLQGRYFYDALCCTSPLFRDLLKDNKPLPYTEKPYGFEDTKSEEEKQKEIESKRLQAYIFFNNWARANKDIK